MAIADEGVAGGTRNLGVRKRGRLLRIGVERRLLVAGALGLCFQHVVELRIAGFHDSALLAVADNGDGFAGQRRSEEHTSELQSLMRISYAVFCLKKKQETTKHHYKIKRLNITQQQI